MGFTGYVNSDTGISTGMPWGVESLTRPERFARAIDAGVNAFAGDGNPQPLLDAVAQGLVPMADLDRSAGLPAGRDVPARAVREPVRRPGRRAGDRRGPRHPGARRQRPPPLPRPAPQRPRPAPPHRRRRRPGAPLRRGLHRRRRRRRHRADRRRGDAAPRRGLRDRGRRRPRGRHARAAVGAADDLAAQRPAGHRAVARAGRRHRDRRRPRARARGAAAVGRSRSTSPTRGCSTGWPPAPRPSSARSAR